MFAPCLILLVGLNTNCEWPPRGSEKCAGTCEKNSRPRDFRPASSWAR